MLLTKEGYAMGLIKTQVSNRPNISNMTNWKTIYTLKDEAKTNAVYIYMATGTPSIKGRREG